MQLQNVIGQNRIKKHLIDLFHSGKMPHALLFVGHEGFGGLPLAIAFAQFIFCNNKTEGDACGICANCQQLEKLAYPDLHLTFPAVGSKPNLSKNHLPEFREFLMQSPYGSTFDWLQFINAENKQGNISADECREIINQLNLTSFADGYKIQIIWRPEYLGKEGNILLKLIEEPPEHTLIFLVAEEEDKILNTIRSRTQKVSLQPLTIEEISEALETRFRVEKSRALQIAHVSENSYGKALEIYRTAGQSDWMPALRDWFNALFTFSPVRTSQWVDQMAKNGREQQKHFLIFARQMLTNVLRIGIIPNETPALIGEELNFAQKLSNKKLDPMQIGKINKAIEQTIYHIERNTHGKTQLLALSLEIQYLLKGIAIRPFT